MMHALSHVNWLAVGAAAIAHFVLGGLWFAAIVARLYPVALGIADRPPQRPGPLFLIGPALCSAITIATSAILIRALGIATYGNALLLGAFVGIGYLAPMVLTIAINPLFPRPFLYTAINAPFFLLGSLLSCIMLVALS